MEMQLLFYAYVFIINSLRVHDLMGLSSSAKSALFLQGI